MSTEPTDVVVDTPVVVGVDSSTQSCKVEVRALDTGEVLAGASARHPATQPPVSEQDPTSWWDALTTACSAALGTGRFTKIAAISVGGQQHGLVLLDDEGHPLRPAKLWNDTTSAPQADALVESIGSERWAALTGGPPVAAITVTKLAWVARHEPQLLDRVARVMLPHDYLTWRLTGAHVTDRGDASGTGWFDPTSGEYLSEVLDAAGVNGAEWLERLPRVLQPTEHAGTVLPEVADTLGLSPDTVVAAGSGDNMAAALGLGLRTGDVVVSLGTSGTAYALSATPTRDPSGAVAGFAAASGEFLPLVCTLNATKVTDTVARWLGTDAAGLGELALAANGDTGGARLVPYFDGERTPNLPDATGTFEGLTNSTSREQLALAAHDGVLSGLLNGIDALTTVGAQTDGRRLLIGGGARSGAYRQRFADLTGGEIVIPDAEEAVAAGAAVQAAAVAGGGSFSEISERWNLGRGATVAPQN